MKNILRTAGLLSLCTSFALVSTFSTHAQPDGLYLKADVGGNVTLDTDLREFFGPATPGTKVKFDPGVRVGLAAGYQLTDWFAAEGEFGLIANRLASITGADRVHDATFSNVPFLVNAKFQCPGHGPLTPYFGGGAGFSVAILDADEISIGGTSVSGNASSDAVFAYQAFGGLRYRINDHMGVAVEYRYFAADSPKWRSDFGGGNVRFDGTQTHAVSLTFEYRF
jgi:opacity protein-like surface antigen